MDTKKILIISAASIAGIGLTLYIIYRVKKSQAAKNL